MGGKTVVIDTGMGAASLAASKGANGQFAVNLSAAGIDPKSVDAVVISHFHGDHINGLLSADGTAGVSQRRGVGAGGGVEVFHG